MVETKKEQKQSEYKAYIKWWPETQKRMLLHIYLKCK